MFIINGNFKIDENLKLNVGKTHECLKFVSSKRKNIESILSFNKKRNKGKLVVLIFYGKAGIEKLKRQNF